MNSVVNSRFNPSNLGLDKNFSLIKFSSLKGWGCKVPQKTLFNYLKDIGDGTIGRDTPDCSVTPVNETNDFVSLSTTDFFYPVNIFLK